MVAKSSQALLELLNNDQEKSYNVLPMLFKCLGFFCLVGWFCFCCPHTHARGEEGLHDHGGDVLTDGLFTAKQGLQTSANTTRRCFYFA